MKSTVRSKSAGVSLVLAFTLFFVATPATAATVCADLVNLKISAKEIGLPSGGAVISSAQIATVSADPAVSGMTREYCKVLGAIQPIDPNAPPVNFEVNLPSQWNGKAVQYGGGGYNGTLVTGLAPLRDAKADTPVPVARGFATWGTDSGHEAAKQPEIFSFALNEEALVNFAYASYKKTRDAARRITLAFYDRAPEKIYFYGGSEGGREALTMAQRFPEDYEGIVSIVPVINYVGLGVAGNAHGVEQQNGGWLSPEKLTLLRKAAIAACDAMDGLSDGIVGAYEKCVDRFDPKSLRCPNGADAGNTCLSDAQISAVVALHRPFEYGITLANGMSRYPGWNYGGEDQPGGMNNYVTGSQPAQFPLPVPNKQGTSTYYGNGFVRYFIARDPNYNPLGFRLDNFRARVQEISKMMDSTDPDLSAFLAHGGKLILKVNGADFAPSPFQGINYYKSVVTKMGQERANGFIRFYVAPGANHNGLIASGTTGEAMASTVDLLAVLDSWVGSGNAPGTLTLVAQNKQPPFNVLSSRPMCLYPLYPRYKGQGDSNEASNFTCTAQ